MASGSHTGDSKGCDSYWCISNVLMSSHQYHTHTHLRVCGDSTCIYHVCPFLCFNIKIFKFLKVKN